jgi:hypothetical protein
MLKKLFGVNFFGGFISHLVHHEAILPTSLGEFNLPFIVQSATPGMLGIDHSYICHSFPIG